MPVTDLPDCIISMIVITVGDTLYSTFNVAFDLRNQFKWFLNQSFIFRRVITWNQNWLMALNA